MNKKKYDIITNINNRRILVINDILDIEQTPALTFNDFDAIFLNLTSSITEKNLLAIRLASPLLSEKCRFKPCYVTQRLRGCLELDGITIDGYAVTPHAKNMTNGIEELYHRMSRINFLLDTKPVVSSGEEFFRIFRYAISRGRFTFTSRPIPGLNIGATSLFSYTQTNRCCEMQRTGQHHFCYAQLLKQGYIRYLRFVEKIHLCPHCGNSHLLFIETCQKCNSSNIIEEPVLHHFRCANVTPESTYQWDGALRCPKCKHYLRHIGIDYDRPSAIYTCQQCDNSFVHAGMRVLCTSCKKTSKTEELLPENIEEFEFTAEGIKAFASYEIIQTLSQVAFTGYSSMGDFTNYIRMIALSDDKKKNALIIIRFLISESMSDKNDRTTTILPVVYAMKRFSNYKSTIWKNNYFFAAYVPEGDIARMREEMKQELKSQLSNYQEEHKDFQFELIKAHTYYAGNDVELFINTIKNDPIHQE